jgi:hypothetical protein
MSVHEVSPLIPSLDVPRAHPCEASGIGPGSVACGATPASEWERYCLNGHTRQVRLCGIHAAMITSGGGQCADCADRGAVSMAMLRPLDLLLAGHAGGIA